MDDLFDYPALRIEQPKKVLETQTRYDIFPATAGKHDPPIMIAMETDAKTRGQAFKQTLPAAPVPGDQVLIVRTPDDVARLFIRKREGNRLTEVHLAEGGKVGSIQAERTTRHYRLLGPYDELIGKAVGELSLKSFTITDVEGDEAATITKKWAGLAKELLTTADRYEVRLTAEGPLRILAVALTLVLDLTLHETHGHP